MQQQLIGINTNSNYLQTLANISALNGMTQLVQSQVTSLSQKTGEITTLTTQVQNQVSSMNATVQYLSQLVNVPNLKFNGSIGNCLTAWTAQWSSGSAVTFSIVPMLSTDLVVINPNIGVELLCQWDTNQILGNGNPQGQGNMALAVFAEGQGNLFSQNYHAPSQAYNANSTWELKTGLYHLRNVSLVINWYSFIRCITLCVTIQY